MRCCPNCGFELQPKRKVKSIRDIKLMSDNGRSLGAFANHYGRDAWSNRGVNHNHNWDSKFIRQNLAREPIMVFLNQSNPTPLNDDNDDY